MFKKINTILAKTLTLGVPSNRKTKKGSVLKTSIVFTLQDNKK